MAAASTACGDGSGSSDGGGGEGPNAHGDGAVASQGQAGQSGGPDAIAISSEGGVAGAAMGVMGGGDLAGSGMATGGVGATGAAGVALDAAAGDGGQGGSSGAGGDVTGVAGGRGGGGGGGHSQSNVDAGGVAAGGATAGTTGGAAGRSIDASDADASAPADASSCDAEANVAWTSKELLGRPTDHSITLKAVAAQSVDAYTEYGTASGAYAHQTIATTFPDGAVEAPIEGLSPDTLYYYRLRYRTAGSSCPYATGTEYTFHTQRAPGASFSFAIQSDSHLGYQGFNDPNLYTITMQNIAAEQPDFLLDLGDAVSLDDATETAATVSRKYLDQRRYFEIPGHSAAIFLVLGNHEREEGWFLNDFGDNVAATRPVLSANARKQYFANPVPDGFFTGNSEPVAAIDGDHLRGDYYAFEWGDALFVAIDPFWYTTTKPYAGAIGGERDDQVETVGTRWDWTLGQQQYLWLKSTLAGSHARFKFVFAHHEAGGIDDYGRGGALAAKFCEWGGDDLDGLTNAFATERPGWDGPIHQLFVQNGVTAFFHGHDHVYAQETLDGVVYQEVPMAANSNYDTGFSTNRADYAGSTMIANSGHLLVTVAPDGATVSYVRSYLPGAAGTNRTVAASYKMTPSTPVTPSSSP